MMWTPLFFEQPNCKGLIPRCFVILVFDSQWWNWRVSWGLGAVGKDAATTAHHELRRRPWGKLWVSSSMFCRRRVRAEPSSEIASGQVGGNALEMQRQICIVGRKWTTHHGQSGMN